MKGKATAGRRRIRKPGWGGLAAAVLDEVAALVCVLDAKGEIVAANRAWRTTRPPPPLAERVEVGASYLGACDRAAAAGAGDAAALAAAIRAVQRRGEGACFVPLSSGGDARVASFEHAGARSVAVSLAPAAAATDSSASLSTEALRRALRESEDRYHSLLEHMQHGFAYCRMIWDGDEPADFIYLAVNERFATITGLGDVTGRLVSEVIPGIRASNPELFAAYGVVAREGTPTRREVFVGAMSQWFDISVFSPAPDHFVALFDVITEHKRRDAELGRREERLRVVHEAARAGSWEWTLETNENVWSDQLWALYGLEQDCCEPSYAAWRTTIHAADVARVEQTVERVVASGGELDIEWRVVDRDGSERWLMSRGRPVRDDEDRVVRYIGIVLDITGRKLTEEALRERAEELGTIMELAPVAIWFARDPQCLEVVGNRTANHFFEAQNGDNVSANLEHAMGDARRRYFQNGRELDASELPMQLAAERAVAVRDAEIEILLPDGRRLTMWGSAAPLLDAHGHVRGSLGAFMDVTERKRAEAKLAAYQVDLQRMAFEATVAEERERRRIAADLHDRIGQALVAAKSKLSMAREVAGVRARGEIDGAIELVGQTIQDARTLMFDISPPILYDLGLWAALSWLADEVAKSHGLRVVLSGELVHPLLDDVTAALVFRAVRELVLNVVRHAGTSTVRIAIRRDGRVVETVVEDDGRGFDVAARHPSAGGFGLFGVREQIARLGGSLALHSTPGSGTRAVLRVPIVEAGASWPPESDARPDVEAPGPPVKARARRPRRPPAR